MKLKSVSLLGLIALLLVTTITPEALAGRKQRHRWEGVAIGVGAAILGSALLNHHSNGAYYNAPVINPPPYRHPPRVRGHWEIHRRWVPPVHERVWNPGHYNRRGHWVPGEHIEIERSPGYWTEDRIWVGPSRY